MSAVDDAGKKIVKLIGERRFDEAEKSIDSASCGFSQNEQHRVIAWRAFLSWEKKRNVSAMNLMRTARDLEPKHLPHAYWLGIMQQELDLLDEAIDTFRSLIVVGQREGNNYFENEARFRIVVCLKKLGRTLEAKKEKDTLPKGLSIFLDDGLLSVDDL